MAKATIRDVAELAGVSVSTVSRALNDLEYPMTPEMKKRVWDAAKQLNFQPGMAKFIQRDTIRDVGLVIPNITNPFYLQTMLGINDVLSKNGYNVILCNTMRNSEQERDYLRRLFERKTRGVILSSVDSNADTIKDYAAKGMQFVLLDQQVSGLDATSINFDTKVGARMSTEHLIALGHTKIAFASLPMTRWTRRQMHQGYQEALTVAGLTYDPALTYERKPETMPVNRELELEAGKCIADAFVADGCPATAFVCINDMLAIGLIKQLQKRGIRIPEDVSVFGFDDIPFASAFEPSLTTVHYPAIEAGRLAATMLLEKMEQKGPSMQMSMQLTPTIVERDTVSAPKKKKM